jgi:hypothetical protein
MATATLGTAATSTLTALPFVYGLVPADFATIAAAIKRDTHNGSVTTGLTGPQPPLGLPFSRAGVLIIPERGTLKLFPGDYVAVDGTGWPILLSARAAASASWVHAP